MSQNPPTPSQRPLEQMMQSFSAKWQSDEMTQRRDQMRQGVQDMTGRVQDLMSPQSVGKWKEQLQNTRSEPGLTGQLGMLNERMKEEMERRDVRREAEEACLRAMEEHLVEFLQEQPEGTYEEWIAAFHPENTQDSTLLHDMEYTEVDMRFYVEQSDHRQLWNRHVQARPVAARTRMFASTQQTQPPPDLLGMEPNTNAVTPSLTPDAGKQAPQKDQEVDLISF